MTNVTDNVSPSEINKFDQLATDWWNPHGKMKPLHLLNPLRLQYIQQHCNSKQSKILDVGCGGGILSEALAKQGAEVSAIDLSPAALDTAKQHASNNGLEIDYQLISAEALAKQQAQQFDVITCMELLEHVPKPASVIKACATLVKPGGKVFFSTINRHPKAFLLAILGAEYILQMLPKGTHHYSQFIQPAELNRWARAANLQLKNLSGVHYQPTQASFTLSKDVKVNYLTCYQLEE